MRSLMRFVLSVCLLASVSVFAAGGGDAAAVGRAALQKGDAEAAATAFEKAIAAEPNNATYHYLLGSAYGQQAQKASIFSQAGLAKKTKAEFEKAVALDPNHMDARFGLIQYFLLAPAFMGGGDDKAVAQAAEMKKRDALMGHRAYARIYLHQKKKDLAQKEMVEAVREQPNNGRGHYYLANFYFNEQNWPAAQHEYEMAIKLEPAFMPTYFRVGQLSAKTGKDFARAEESLRKYLGYTPADNEPSLAAAWYWLGQVQEKAGKKAEAKASYTNALRLSPGDKDITAALKGVS